MDRAVLSFGAERYWGTTEGCHDPNARHHTEGGTFTLVNKGNGEMYVTLKWSEAGSRPKVPRLVTTFVGLVGRFWPEKDGSPVPPAGSYSVSSFCYTVLPSSQDAKP
jgi:hypothetical protein